MNFSFNDKINLELIIYNTDLDLDINNNQWEDCWLSVFSRSPVCWSYSAKNSLEELPNTLRHQYACY